MATASKEAVDYIKEIKKQIAGLSYAKKVSILLERLQYWHWSAIDWRNMYEERTEEMKK